MSMVTAHAPRSVIANFLRYPGSKRRMLAFLGHYLPSADAILGRHVEPFVGGGAVFLYMQPHLALLSDINSELIDVYRGIRHDPNAVWKEYCEFGSTKADYWHVRRMPPPNLMTERAARTLYLNRTCFKGMWRHNREGRFNVGYGGQSRRWVIGCSTLVEISRHLRRAQIRCLDFETVVDESESGDFLFLDPPYRPGERELVNDHYSYRQFKFDDHRRLAAALKRAERRGVSWLMTTSSHPDIVLLFKNKFIVPFPRGTGHLPGKLVKDSGEILVMSFNLQGVLR